MLLQELIDEDLLNPELLAEEKNRVIEELAELFVKNSTVKNKDEFIADIKKREDIESTGIGNGVAIPHARSNSVNKLRVAFGRSIQGIDFKALDRKPVKLIFMIAAPTEARKEYLQAIAKIARFLKSETLKGALLRATSRKAMMDIIRDFDGVLPESLKVETKEGRVIYKNGN